MARHLPGSVWALYRERRGDGRPIEQAYIRTTEDNHLKVTFVLNDERGAIIVLNRHEARLLARRIDQCLEASK